MNFKLQSFSRVISYAGLKALLSKTHDPKPSSRTSAPMPATPSRPPPIRKATRCPEKKAGGDGNLARDTNEDCDGKDEMHGDSTVAAARRRERARCAAIMGCQAAARNPALAANLAFKTRLSRQEAIEFLESLPIEALVPPPSLPPRLKAPSLVRTNSQQIAEQRLKLAITQANYERSVR